MSAISAQPVARTARARAHTSGVTLPVGLIARDLASVLGRELLGVIAAKEERTVRRWVAGASSPTGATAARLRDTYQIVELLRTEEGDHTIRAWFMGMNPQLDDSSPAEVLAEGRARDVMLAARAFVTGG